MKIRRFLAMAAMLIFLLPSEARADLGSGGMFGGGGAAIATDTDCNQAKYYTDGTICQDTDDNIVYIGTGAAVQVIGTGGSQPLDADLTTIAALASIANITALAGLTATAQAVIGWDDSKTLTAFTSHSHSDTAAQFYSATASKGTILVDVTGVSDKVLYTVKPIADANTTFSPGKTFTNGKWCSYATATGLTCNETPGEGTGDFLADGSVPMTGAIDLVTTGVKLTGSNGSLTILGQGDGQDEDVKIDLNTTANTITVSSPASGATAVSLSALNLVTTGYIDGGILVTKSTDATVTVSGMSKMYINADDDAIAFNLPADPTNKAYCFANLLYAKAITVNPDDADYIVHSGVTAAAGEEYVSSGARTDQVCVVGIDASYWLVTSERGTWAETTPP